MTICLTGTLSKPRKEWEVMIEEAGHNFTNRISKDTSFLVVGDGGGVKKAKAIGLGIPIKEETWLTTFLSK